jgi:hypothetical protein
LAPLLSVFPGILAKFHQPRFLRLQLQSEVFESLLYGFKEAFRLVFVLECNYYYSDDY